MKTKTFTQFRRAFVRGRWWRKLNVKYTIKGDDILRNGEHLCW